MHGVFLDTIKMYGILFSGIYTAPLGALLYTDTFDPA